jgi:hypothetical protein
MYKKLENESENGKNRKAIFGQIRVSSFWWLTANLGTLKFFFIKTVWMRLEIRSLIMNG